MVQNLVAGGEELAVLLTIDPLRGRHGRLRYATLRGPPWACLGGLWQCDVGSDVAGSITLLRRSPARAAARPGPMAPTRSAPAASAA